MQAADFRPQIPAPPLRRAFLRYNQGERRSNPLESAGAGKRPHFFKRRSHSSERLSIGAGAAVPFTMVAWTLTGLQIAFQEFRHHLLDIIA